MKANLILNSPNRLQMLQSVLVFYQSVCFYMFICLHLFNFYLDTLCVELTIFLMLNWQPGVSFHYHHDNSLFMSPVSDPMTYEHQYHAFVFVVYIFSLKHIV